MGSVGYKEVHAHVTGTLASRSAARRHRAIYTHLRAQAAHVAEERPGRVALRSEPLSLGPLRLEAERQVEQLAERLRLRDRGRARGTMRRPAPDARLGTRDVGGEARARGLRGGDAGAGAWTIVAGGSVPGPRRRRPGTRTPADMPAVGENLRRTETRLAPATDERVTFERRRRRARLARRRMSRGRSRPACPTPAAACDAASSPLRRPRRPALRRRSDDATTRASAPRSRSRAERRARLTSSRDRSSSAGRSDGCVVEAASSISSRGSSGGIVCCAIGCAPLSIGHRLVDVDVDLDDLRRDLDLGSLSMS